MSTVSVAQNNNNASNTDISAALLNEVIALVRAAINEDWILDMEMDADTSLNRDLEIESMDFVAIANLMQQQYGDVLDIAAWLSGKDIKQLVNLTIGDLASHVANCTGKA